jgi:hypothetical protein
MFKTQKQLATSTFEFIACNDVLELTAILLAKVDGKEYFPVYGETDLVEVSPFPEQARVYLEQAERLLLDGKDALAKHVLATYEIENHDAVIVSHDNEPLWYVHSLLWAVQTKRAWRDESTYKDISTYGDIEESRRLYVGSPDVPMYTLVEHFKQVPLYLTGTCPKVLNRLLIKTLLYKPEEQEDNCIFRVEAQTTTFAKAYPQLCEPAAVLNVRMKKGGHMLFINGHAGDDFLITDSMVLCGKQANASYDVLPDKEVAPVCYNTGKCFTDVLPSWVNRRSYVLPTEDLAFKHMVIYGCRSFYLGHNPYGPYFDLALGAISGQAVTYIGSFENVDTELEQVFFLNILLRTGHTIGDALDIYNDWAFTSYQGRAPLRAIGDPQVRYFTPKDIPVLNLSESDMIKLDQPTWTFKVTVDKHLSENVAIDVKRLDGESDEIVNFALQYNEDSTDIWVFAPQRLKAGCYKVKLIDLISLDRLNHKLINLHYRLNLLSHLQILDNDSRKSIKVLREKMSQVIQTIPTIIQQADGEQFSQVISSFFEELPKVQKSVLTPLIENLYSDIGNPLMMYDKRRIYGKDIICDCPICGNKMSISDIRFPGVPRSDRVREQCVNCEMMLERPKDTKTELKVKVEEFLDKAVATITLVNHSDETIHASLGSVIEMGVQWGADLPKYMDVTLQPKETVVREIIVSSEVIAPVPRQYLFILGLIDMEWFYYSVGLLPRKAYHGE